MTRTTERLRHLDLDGTAAERRSNAPDPELEHDDTDYGYEPCSGTCLFRYLFCSTAHIRPKDDELLAAAARQLGSQLLCVDRATFGYWVLVPEASDYSGDFQQSLIEAGYSLGVIRIIDKAVRECCVWVKLDPGGPYASDLPRFEW